MTKLSSVFAVINEMSVGLSGEKTYIRILLKIIGITYVTDFSSAICKDAGFSAIAGQIVMFGKIAILAISSPIILTLLETVYGFL
jgi:stage III sporulation protein AD